MCGCVGECGSLDFVEVNGMLMVGDNILIIYCVCVCVWVRRFCCPKQTNAAAEGEKENIRFFETLSHRLFHLGGVTARARVCVCVGLYGTSLWMSVACQW